MRRVLAVVAVAALAVACSGGEDASPFDEDEEDTADIDVEDEETTTTEGSVVLDVPSSFTASGTFDEVPLSAVVAGPDRYVLTIESNDELGGCFEQRRSGGEVLVSQEVDCRDLGTGPYVAGSATEATAVGSFLQAADLGELPAADEGFTAADLVLQAVVELLVTDPAALLGDDVVTGEDLDLDLPSDLADALADVGYDEPDLDALVEADGDALVVDLFVGDGGQYRVEVTFTDIGDVTDSDIAEVPAELVDATPWVEEEELLAYTETPLLVPPVPPEGMALVGAVVLDAFETREGCVQAQLDYAVPGGDPDVFVEYFLIDKVCANQFDPTPFDETTGGLPSRHDGFEILLGATVVQVAAGDPDFDVGAFVASLVAIPADQLVAAVVPPD